MKLLTKMREQQNWDLLETAHTPQLWGLTVGSTVWQASQFSGWRVGVAPAEQGDGTSWSQTYLVQIPPVSLPGWSIFSFFLCFLTHCLGLSSLPCQEAIIFPISWLQSPSNSDFRAQEEETCHCLHLLSCFSWSDGTGCCDLCFLNI